MIKDAKNAGIAKRLREQRKAKGLTQEKLAEVADIAVVTLQKIEQGSSFGDRQTHERLAEELGMSVAYLVYGNEVDGQRMLPVPNSLTEQDVYIILEHMEFIAYRRSKEQHKSRNQKK